VQNDTRIGVDIAKSVFEVAVSDRPGRVSRCVRLKRPQFLEFFAQQPAATVFMEACGSAHYWARRIEQLGHRVVLLPPHQVRPYVKRNKTDRTDAKGILEASRNEDIRPVPIKSVPQQVLTSLHRLRQGWMTERTARLNALRGLLRELGVFIPVGAENVVPAVWALIEDADSNLPRHPEAGLRRGVSGDPRDRGPRQAGRAPARGPGRAAPRRRPAAQHPRHRAPDRDRAGRLHRRRAPLPLGPPPGQLPGPHPARVLERAQALPGTHLQARRWLPAHPAHPRRALGASTPQAATRSHRQLARAPGRQAQPQRRRRGASQQERAHRLGAARAPARLRTRVRVDCTDSVITPAT